MSNKRKHDHNACRSIKGIRNVVCLDCAVPLGQYMYDRCYVCQDILRLRTEIAAMTTTVYQPPIPWYGR